VMRISRQPSPVQFMTDQKQQKNVEYFNYFRSVITNCARCTRDSKYRIATEKVACNKKADSFQHQIGLKLKKATSTMLYLEHSFVWCWNFDTSESISEIHGKFGNVVLETGGEDQLARSCEKWSVAKRQGGKGYATNNEKKAG